MALPLEDQEAAKAANTPQAPVQPVATGDGGVKIYSDPAAAQAEIDAHPEVYGKKPEPAKAPPATPTEQVSPQDLDAFTDYMYSQSQSGALGSLPAVKYTGANATPDYKARLVKGNPATYAAWKANRPAEASNIALNADTAAAVQATPTPTNVPTANYTDVGTPPTGGEDTGLPSYMTAGRELAASMTPEDRLASDTLTRNAAANVPLNASGTAPAGQTASSFKSWLEDKFGKKADRMDFWDAIEIWGAALAGNEPRMYNQKMEALKTAKAAEQRKTELAEERDFEMRLQNMLADRETQKLLAMQGFEANQANLGYGFQANQAANAQAFTANQNALDRALRAQELEKQYELLKAQMAANAYGGNYTGFRPTIDRGAVYGTNP